MSKSNFYVYDKASGKYNLQGVLTLGCCTEGAGESGDSAYDIAVKNGFVYTEGEWLESLKGTKFFIAPTSMNAQTIPPEGARVGDLVVSDAAAENSAGMSFFNYGDRQFVSGECAPILSLNPFKIGDTLGCFTGRSVRWMSGNGAPEIATGNLHDWYIDLNNGDVYEKNADWVYKFNIFLGKV